MSADQVSVLRAFVEALRPRESASKATLSTFCSAWTRWQEEVFLPRLKALAQAPEAARDPAWSHGDRLRVLDISHENAYSDWLAWLLEAGGSGGGLQPALVEALCPAAAPAPRFELVAREQEVVDGDEDQEGRLDVALEAPGVHRAVVIEAKVRNPDQAELVKHEKYIRVFKADHPAPWQVQFVLLVPDVHALAGLNLHGFSPVGWNVVTLAIRRLLQRGALDGSPQLAAFSAAFTAAVESKLLGLPVAAWRALLCGEHRSHASTHALSSSGLLEYLEAVDAK